ncbi:MAG: FtsL-like putative cell division protein [Bacteroidota bacterium]|nr:FtsL-like putative cell division protein [Bacteroidota bacterium]
MAKAKSKEEVEEFIDPKIESKEYKKASIKELIDGTILTRKTLSQQLPFIFFLSFLAAIYIGNRYHAEKVIRGMTKLQQEVVDLRAESITTASELMFISKQSEVIKMVNQEQLGLEESTTPPIKIKK